jgi:hypothetical protein
MQKTYCDRCGGEITRKKLHLVKYELLISCVDEDAEGNLETTETLKAELCSPCRAAIGEMLTVALRKT